MSQGYIEDSSGAYYRRVYRAEFAALDPLNLPWKEMRRSPEQFPDVHMAKIQSARTVAGIWFETASGDKVRIYLKRSFIHGRIRKFFARYRQTKEWREFILAQEFMAAGFHVPEPVYYSESVDPTNGNKVTFYATLALEERFKDCKAVFRDKQEFGREWHELAGFTRRLHGEKVLHADYRSNHIFLDTNNNKSGWALIDLDGSRVGRTVSTPERVRAISQLTESLLRPGLQVEDLAQFLEIYDPENRFSIDADAIYTRARLKSQKK